MNQITVYEEHAEKHERAWRAFNRIYILERPEPAKPEWWRGLPVMMIPFGLIAVAGILLSAMRTAPVFYNVALPLVGEGLSIFEAIFAIIAVEVFVVMVRYALIVLYPEKTHDISFWMVRGFIAALIVALMANLYGSVSHLPFLTSIKPFLDLIMGVVVGVSAPVFAVISGDILGILWLNSAKHRSQLKSEFEQSMEEWRDKREGTWNSKKSDYGIRIHVPKISSGIPMEIPMENNRGGSSIGHSKNTKAREIVERYFDENENAVNQDPLEVAAFLQVGKSTVYNVRSERRKVNNGQ